jgi:hypothetical protein
MMSASDIQFVSHRSSTPQGLQHIARAVAEPETKRVVSANGFADCNIDTAAEPRRSGGMKFR